MNKLMHLNNIISSQEHTFPPVWRITLLGTSFASAHPSKKFLSMITTRPHKLSSLHLLPMAPKVTCKQTYHSPHLYHPDTRTRKHIHHAYHILSYPLQSTSAQW